MLMLAGRAPVEAATMSSLAQAASNQTGNTANRNRAQLSKDLSGLPGSGWQAFCASVAWRMSYGFG